MAMALPAGPAAAHAILVDSSPAPYAHLPAGSVAMVLRYNSRIDAARSKLTRLTTDDAGKPDMLHATVNLAPGEYTIKWQVLATDGHITRGSVPFTVAGAAH